MALWVYEGLDGMGCSPFILIARGGVDTVDQMPGLNMGLGALPLMSSARTRSISAENPTGAKGMGGMAVPDPEGAEWSVSSPARELGRGWKVRPYVWLRSGGVDYVDGCGRVGGNSAYLDDYPEELEWERSGVRVEVLLGR